MTQDPGTVFDLYDAGLAHALPKSEVAHVVRTCGRMLLPRQMTTLLEKYPDPMTRDQVIEAVSEPLPEGPGNKESREADLLQALQAFDSKESGVLQRFEVQQLFCAMQDKISVSEFDQGLAHANCWDGDKCDLHLLERVLTLPVSSIVIPQAELKQQLQAL